MLKGSEVNRLNFRMFLALEGIVKLLVAIKEVPTSSIYRINKELSIYREIEENNLEVSVSRLYQMYTHGNIFVLVKEPYEMTLLDFIGRHAKEYVLISWEFIIKSIEETLTKTIQTLKRKYLHLVRMISTEDIVYAFGEWKLHSPEMFNQETSNQVEVSQVLELLREEIMGRIAGVQSESQLRN